MPKDKAGKGGDYEIGYGKAPKEYQFKKGRSGNPKGRPKSRKPGQTDIAELLSEPVKVKAGGKVNEMSPFEAGVRKLAKRALEGDLPAILKFVRLCEKYDVIAPPAPVTGSGVVWAPKGVEFFEWIDSVTEEVPLDEI